LERQRQLISPPIIWEAKEEVVNNTIIWNKSSLVIIEGILG
jgi:hypothetical protein